MQYRRPIIQESKNYHVLIKGFVLVAKRNKIIMLCYFIIRTDSCVINISIDNCRLNESVLFIKTVSSYICCVATKMCEWLIGNFLILWSDVKA
jgi:hypothetical protein